MYHLIHLSVGLSAFYRKFSCIGRTYHVIYQVWGFLLSTGNFHASDMHTISSTKCEAFHVLQEIFMHWTYVPFQPPSVGLFAGNFRASDVHTISSTKCGTFRFLQEIFVYRTCVPFHPPSVGLSTFCRKFSCIGRTYHG